MAKLVTRAKEFARRFRVDDGKKFRLKEFSPNETLGLRHGEGVKDLAAETLREEIELLSEMQDKLYAQDRWGLLLIFQAMDAAGKDGTIKHVMSGVNPQGCQVTSFKQPSAEELDHDFLWRCAKALPERGRIGIFNRSYYEEVLVVRVHESILDAQQLPASARGAGLWGQRFESINDWERHLSRNGTKIVKVFLHVSKDEQKRRFIDRLDDPAKQWKFSLGDVHERAHWDEYQAAYEEAITATSTAWAPWYVVPADRKWLARTLVAALLARTIEGLDLQAPVLDPEQRAELEEARRLLQAE